MAAEDSSVSSGGSPLPPALDSAYERTFAEPIQKFLDLDTWHTGRTSNEYMANYSNNSKVTSTRDCR